MTGGRAGDRRDQIREAISQQFLGDRVLTSDEVAARTGVSSESAKELWAALGFTEVPDDEAAFSAADVEAVVLLNQLRELGFVTGDEHALVRTMGRSFSRLAEWQLDIMSAGIDLDRLPPAEVARALETVQPMIEKLMLYVWRRHAAANAARVLLAKDDGEEERVLQVVGFADIVGYTRQSRQLDGEELTELVESFESTVQSVMAEFGGRVIKSIGDEVLFVVEDPLDAARIALALVAARDIVPGFPQLRVGLAQGSVLAHLGDVYGEVVNIAARLTSVARPGKICLDATLAGALKPVAAEHGWRVRRLRRTAVKGYRRLEPWSLKQKVVESAEAEQPDDLVDGAGGVEVVDQVD